MKYIKYKKFCKMNTFVISSTVWLSSYYTQCVLVTFGFKAPSPGVHVFAILFVYNCVIEYLIQRTPTKTIFSSTKKMNILANQLLVLGNFSNYNNLTVHELILFTLHQKTF